MWKFILNFVVIYSCSCNLIIAQNPACKEKLKDVLPMEDCCKIPDLLDDAITTPIISDLEKKHKDTPILLECLIDQEIMKKFSLEKIEKDAAKKLAKKVLKESPWLAPIESSIDECVDQIPKVSQIYQKAFNFSKDKCDAQYTFFNDCLEILAFSKCLPQDWTSSEKCEIMKKFVLECQNDEAMMKFIDMQRNFF